MSLPSFCGEHAQELELVRRQLRPARRRGADRRFSRSIASSPISTTGSADGLDAPQRGAQPRQQLVDAERLGDVVVGAGIERGDLLVLVADGREDEDRDVRPAAQLAGRRRRRFRPEARGRG